MIKSILTKAGFIENETFKETRFLIPPKEKTYCVYMDSWSGRGSDDYNYIREHSYSIEVYQYYPDEESEEKIERILDNLGLEYQKHERYWIEQEQLYQTIYDFDYLEKKGR